MSLWTHTLTKPRRAAAILISLAEKSAADGQTDLALDLLWLVASRSWWADPGPDARARAIDALDRVATDRDDPRVLCALGYADAEAFGTEVVTGLERARDAEERDPRTAWMLGTAAVVSGAWNLAPSFLRSHIRMLREQGRLGQLPRVLVLDAMVAARMADWDAAIPACEEAKALAVETGQSTWVGAVDSILALVAATRGDASTALAAADRAEEAIAALGTTFVRTSAQFARATVALQKGDSNEAFDRLSRLFNHSDPAYHWTMKWWGFSDLAQAAARLGRVSEIQALLSEFEVIAAHSPAVWVQMNLDHARAYLASDADADALFEKALSADLRLWPYQRARLLLAHGEWLRRVRRTAESRVPLREAVEVFDAIGAVGWSERAGHELRAAGERVREKRISTIEELTPQELQVAQLAAEGRTNREIAQMLYISHRTVSSHLYRAFPKLGTSHRSELSDALSARSASAD